MAGIVGYIGESIARDDPKLIDRMIEEIKYVPTDTVDLWSKDDLSIARVHHGVVNPEKQPIFNENNSLFIFMDGEVYDYEDEKQFLVKNGHRFQYEQNDAEFCLHLYEELGEEAFIKLNGSFLIAIYDLRTKELILVNDRFSSCPLFYYAANGYLIFGAQLKAVIQSHLIPRNLDFQAVMEFFTFQKVLGNKTYYSDIKVAAPATIMKFRDGRATFEKYWEMNYREGKKESIEYYADAFADTIKRAVKRRNSDRHKYGMLLSGGLDSRVIFGETNSALTAFTVCDFENREVEIAKKIADTKSCPHVYLHRGIDYYANILQEGIELGDGMYSFQHAHFTGFMNEIRKECDVILHGYAFDVIYRGFFLPSKTLNILGKAVTFPKLAIMTETTLPKSILESRNSLWGEHPHKLFSKDLCKSFDDSVKMSVKLILEEGRHHATNIYNIFDYFETHFPCKHFSFLNRICIKNFVDERTTAYDNDLFNLYLEIPPEFRFKSIVFKKALEKLNWKLANIHDANTGLSPTMPLALEWGIGIGKRLLKNINEPRLAYPFFTQGSWPNMKVLIKHNETLRRNLWDVINDEGSLDPVIFNRQVILEMFDMYLRNQKPFTWFFFLILTFGIWYKKYGPR